MQFGITFAWLLLWITTVAREVLHGSTRSLAHAYAASAPVIALGFTSSIWELSNAGLAWITLPAAILYALAALALWHFGEVSFSRTHALVRLLFLTLTLVLVLDGDALFIILAAGAAILPYLAKRYSDGAISVGGICCPASPGSGSPPASSPILWTLLARLARRSPTYPPPSTYPLSLSRSPPRTRSCRAPRPESTGPWRTRRFWPGRGVGSRSFRGVTAWYRRLGPLPRRALIPGLRFVHARLVRGALATLLLVVGKLFLVALAKVDVVWLVPLFLGLGGHFLALSYYLRSLWRLDSRAGEGCR